MKAPMDERLVCGEIIALLLEGRGSLASLLAPGSRSREDFNYSLLQEYCYGVCRWYHKLDAWALTLLDKPLRLKDRDVYCLILLGLYQLHFMRTPEHAAVHETVAAADSLGKPWAKGLVNAVLRSSQRRQQELEAADERDYARLYSHPQWLLDQLKQDWPADYRAILDANNQRAPMTLRVNLARVTRESFQQMLHDQGIASRPGTLSPTALYLDTPVDVTVLPGFAEGLASVQDEASQLLPMILPVRAGQRVLDACAAPGGKTCALMEAVPGLAMVCIDNDSRRLPRLQANLDRCGFQADVRCADLSCDHIGSAGEFDAILLDAPCSATGVIRRHPDIKLLRTPAETHVLVERQAALMEAAWPLLKSGGYLLYSTCSVLKAENAAQVATFLERHADAASIPIEITACTTAEPGCQLLPQVDGSDGFYYALLRKW
jgi:16S rRNA (cytosine967-C5)-methyltransferase